MKMNLGVRFRNPQFIFRLIAAIFVPALAALGIEWQSLTTWGALGDAFIQIISNPVVLALIVYNAINVFPDATVDGISDSERALRYHKPAVNANKKAKN